ncbi:hypothetical protein T492DRAFT_901723 [Pavlovales sp. CCMP2436]|nr:hypothetical protein T492DRAFT_901723 [Pavlovales sp. CCMP2436]
MTHVEGVIRKARAALAGYVMLVGVISANEIRTLQWDVLTKLPQPLRAVEAKLLLEALVEWLNDELISAADFDATRAAFLELSLAAFSRSHSPLAPRDSRASGLPDSGILLPSSHSAAIHSGKVSATKAKQTFAFDPAQRKLAQFFPDKSPQICQGGQYVRKEVVKLKCPKCLPTFLNPQGLSSHMHTHRYVTNPHLLERTFDRVLSILAVTDTVSCLLEKVCLASAKDARIGEQKAEVKARERKRDREDAVLEPSRRGLASRKRYTSHENSGAKVLNKDAEFESTYGIAASTISKWAGDTTRADIAGALGQGYARKLLIISKVNRKVGRYPAMEDAVAAELRSQRKRVLARYFKKLRLRLSARDAGSTSVVDPKWGTYLPEDRAKVD